jgi:hypothetical protein
MSEQDQGVGVTVGLQKIGRTTSGQQFQRAGREMAISMNPFPCGGKGLQTPQRKAFGESALAFGWRAGTAQHARQRMD